MTQAKIETTSQEALEALLCDSMPPQGCWSDEQYLWLTDQTRRLIDRILNTTRERLIDLAGLSTRSDILSLIDRGARRRSGRK